MINSGNRLAAGMLLIGSLSLAATSHAGLITVYGDYTPGPTGPEIYYDATVARGTIECSISCEGLTSWLVSGNYSADVPDLSTADGWSTSSADLFHLDDNGIATELSLINSFSTQAYDSATQTSTGGVDSYGFSSVAEYLLFKIGASPDMFLVRNTSGLEQEYIYTGFSGLGSGLSHVTSASVPEPGSISLLAAGLILVGLMRRRAQKTRDEIAQPA